MKTIFTFLAIIFSLNIFAQWTQKTDFGGTARINAVCFSIDNKGYVGTGYAANGNVLKDLWEYNPTTDIWTQKSDLNGEERYYAIGFSILDKGYIGLGKNYIHDSLGQTTGVKYLKDLWEYDALNNSWTKKADYLGSAIGGNGWPVGFTIGSKAYLGTGNDSTYNPTNDIWEYDPIADKWSPKAFLPVTKCQAASFSIGNKGYIGTGFTEANGNNFIAKDFWEYNPDTDIWTQMADFGGSVRVAAVGFSIGMKGYLGLGSYGNKYFCDFWEYDPATNSWTQTDSLPAQYKRHMAIGFSIGNKGYIGTGYYSYFSINGTIKKYLKDFWEYTPSQITSIKNLSNSSNFKIWHNANTNEIVVTNQNSSAANLAITNIKGVQIHNETISVLAQKSIDISDFSKGIYIATLSNQEQVKSEKFIVR